MADVLIVSKPHHKSRDCDSRPNMPILSPENITRSICERPVEGGTLGY